MRHVRSEMVTGTLQKKDGIPGVKDLAEYKVQGKAGV